MSASTDSPLAAARDAVARRDWAGVVAATEATTTDDPREEAERLDLLAEGQWWLGRLDECITAREAAFLRYEELGDPEAAGRSAVWLWEHHAISARPAIASGWLRRARRTLDDHQEGPAYGMLLLREAETAHGAGDLEVGLALTADVIGLARALGSTDLEAEALQTRGRILIDRGDTAEGLGHLDEAMLFAIEGRLGPFSTGKVYCSLISACEDLGDLDRAAEWTEATMQWAQQHPFAIFPGICRVHRAMVLKRRGSLAEAEREALKATEELITSHVGNSAAAFAEVGDIRRRLGQLENAEDAFDRAQALCGGPCGELSLLRLAQGRTVEAEVVIAGCLSGTTNRLARARLLPVFVHVAIAAGDLDGAGRGLEELDAIAAAYESPVLHATAAMTRGRLELARGDDGAVRSLRGALKRWEALDVPYEVATVRTLLGQALREAGDDADATDSFRLAAELFEQIGAVLEARRVFEEPRPGWPSGLTDREVEVLRLISGGLTNSEIAAALFLSPKTVSRHLSNIFTKIGVSSRAAATAYAFEHGLVRSR